MSVERSPPDATENHSRQSQHFIGVQINFTTVQVSFNCFTPVSGSFLSPDSVKQTEMGQITVKISEETEKWLVKNYPDSINRQEAVRMAISDARLFRMHSDFRDMPNQYQDDTDSSE